jgi:Na+/melibiose symporter-like transporter
VDVPEGNSFALYAPLIVLALVYAAVNIAAAAAGNSRGPEARERLQDVAFAVGLLAAAYTVVLFIVSIVTLPDLVVDLVRIMLVVGAFFAVLLSVLFAIVELIFGRARRTQPLPVAERSADSSSG